MSVRQTEKPVKVLASTKESGSLIKIVHGLTVKEVKSQFSILFKLNLEKAARDVHF